MMCVADVLGKMFGKKQPPPLLASHEPFFNDDVFVSWENDFVKGATEWAINVYGHCPVSPHVPRALPVTLGDIRGLTTGHYTGCLTITVLE